MSTEKSVNPQLVSIIVPVYNVEEYLPRCIESILSQTHRELELILVNDGSTDESGEICDRYALTDERITVIHQENGGECAARNTGLNAARGEWLGFVDSDDYVNERMYEVLLEAALESSVLIACCGFTKFTLGGETDHIVYPELPKIITTPEYLKYRYQGVVRLGTVWCKLHHRSLINGENPLRFNSDCHIAGDTLFVIMSMLKTDKLAYVPQALYYYCIRSTSVSNEPINDKKVTAFISYDRQVTLVSQVYPELAKMAQVYAARNTIMKILKSYYAEGNKRELFPIFRRKGWAYAPAYLSSNTVKLRKKVAYIMILLLPRPPRRLALKLKEVKDKRKWKNL